MDVFAHAPSLRSGHKLLRIGDAQVQLRAHQHHRNTAREMANLRPPFALNVLEGGSTTYRVAEHEAVGLQ